MTTRLVALALAAAMLPLTGCDDVKGTTSEPPTVRASASATPEDPTHEIPPTPGELVMDRSGIGPTLVLVPTQRLGVARMTVRLSCVGPGTARLTDGAGTLIMTIAGCPAHAIYGAGPFKTSVRDQRLELAVDPAARWRMAVYLDG